MTAWPPTVVIVSSGEIDEQREAEAEQADDDDTPCREVVVLLIPDASRTRLEFAIDGLHRRKHRSVEVVVLHVSHDARLRDVVAFHVGEVALKAFARCNEILMILDRYHDDQSASRLLVANAIAVADVLSHAEAITVLDPVDDDKHRLHTAILL